MSGYAKLCLYYDTYAAIYILCVGEGAKTAAKLREAGSCCDAHFAVKILHKTRKCLTFTVNL
jgi:hypothetical protein